MLRLQGIGTHTPGSSVAIAELGGHLGLTPAQVRLHTKFFGQDKVVVARDTDVVGMLVPAGEDALRGADRDSVRYLLYAHTVQHVAPPGHHVLDRVRRELGLRNATAFALSQQNCVSALYAVQLAQYLLHDAEPGSQVLIMAGEKTLSPAIQLIPGTTVMGEATAACLVGTGAAGDEVLAVATRTLGRFYRCNDCSDELKAEYGEIYAGTLVSVMNEALGQAGFGVGDVAAVLPHNVNRFSWKQLSRGLGIPLEKVYLDNVSKLGHCFGADPFINLSDAKKGGIVGPGDLVLLATAGLGATFAAIVARVGEGSNQ